MAVDAAMSARALADAERRKEKEEYDAMFGDSSSAGGSAGDIEEGR